MPACRALALGAVVDFVTFTTKTGQINQESDSGASEKALRFLEVSKLLQESGPLVLPPPRLPLPILFITSLVDSTAGDDKSLPPPALSKEAEAVTLSVDLPPPGSSKEAPAVEREVDTDDAVKLLPDFSLMRKP